MRILIDICHPAHAHFFHNPIGLLKQRGHELLITSRVKEMATALLDGMGISHRTISSQADGSITGFVTELVQRNYRLHGLVRRFRPDVMAAIGGTFISHVGCLTRTPALVFYDTENAQLQNAIVDGYPSGAPVVTAAITSSRIYIPDTSGQGATLH